MIESLCVPWKSLVSLNMFPWKGCQCPFAVRNVPLVSLKGAFVLEFVPITSSAVSLSVSLWEWWSSCVSLGRASCPQMCFPRGIVSVSWCIFLCIFVKLPLHSGVYGRTIFYVYLLRGCPYMSHSRYILSEYFLCMSLLYHLHTHLYHLHTPLLRIYQLLWYIWHWQSLTAINVLHVCVCDEWVQKWLSVWDNTRLYENESGSF